MAAHAGPNEDMLAFGKPDKKVYLGRRSEGSIQVDAEFEDNRGEIQAMAFSHDGALLAAADVSGPPVVFVLNTAGAD